MPGASGVDLLKFAKEISPGSFFLLMTALPALDTANRGAQFGADRYVIKGDSLVDHCGLAGMKCRRTEMEERSPISAAGAP